MKKPPVQAQINETVEYVCELCDDAFYYMPPAPLACPSCGNTDDQTLVALSEAEDEEAQDVK